MKDNDDDILDFERRSRVDKLFGSPNSAKDQDAGQDGEEIAGAAFGFLRGLHDRALALELRFRTGDRDTFSYSCLASYRYNPSVGLLVKFTSDITTLVLIHGSNLDAELPGRAINLIERGLQWHRITYIHEMDEDELRKAGEGEPTIDKIEVAEFESQEAIAEWLKKRAPGFVRSAP
jgi:hypothetical protein